MFYFSRWWEFTLRGLWSLTLKRSSSVTKMEQRQRLNLVSTQRFWTKSLQSAFYSFFYSLFCEISSMHHFWLVYWCWFGSVLIDSVGSLTWLAVYHHYSNLSVAPSTTDQINYFLSYWPINVKRSQPNESYWLFVPNQSSTRNIGNCQTLVATVFRFCLLEK